MPQRDDPQQVLDAIARALRHDWKGALNTALLYSGLIEMKYGAGEEAAAIDRSLRHLSRTFDEVARFLAMPVAQRSEASLNAADPERLGSLDGVDVVGSDVTVAVQQWVFDTVVSALVDNARAHGALPIALKVSREGGIDRIEVRDAGPGIDHGKQADVVQPLYTGKPSQHAGMGLARVARWVGDLGGTLTLGTDDGRFVVSASWPSEAE